ncbi:MAG: D-amino acid aminotransferase [Gemmatimonadetes bacterium]|nr:D-amino acid aminotransferase [Gemmatimonadota bacterium]
MPEVSYVNGRFCPLAEAVVSVEDRGYQFADGVYEVVGTYGGRPYALEPHLARLQGNLAALHLPLDIREYGLKAKLMEGIERSGFGDILVYIQVTRGIAPRHHEFPAVPVTPTVVMTFKELRRLPRDLYDRGVEVISTEDLRWKRCDIKTIALLPNILAKQAATQAGVFEALLVDLESRVTEGASTSAFCVQAGRLYTAPIGAHILPSITRGILLDLARKLGIPIDEEFCTLDQFKEADEVFIAGTTLEAMPVVRIDDAIIGDGTPGTITQQIRAAFMESLDLT